MKSRSLLFVISFLVSSLVFLAFALKPEAIFSSDSIPPPKNPYKAFSEVPFDFDTLQAGDLVVRTGRSFFSDQLRQYNTKDDTYSHCALVTKASNGQTLLLHSIGGSENPDNVIRCDSVFSFLSPKEVIGFGVYRYDLPPADMAAIDSLAKLYYDEKRMFDMKFNLEDDERLYCAEYIYKVVINATGYSEMLSLSRQGEKAYVGVDDLYLNNKTNKLFEYEYH